MRITNRLRAIRAREVRWISHPTYDTTDVHSEPRTVGKIIPRGPYAAWLPVCEPGGVGLITDHEPAPNDARMLLDFERTFGAWVDRQRGWRAARRIRDLRAITTELLAGRPNPGPYISRQLAQRDALALTLLRQAENIGATDD